MLQLQQVASRHGAILRELEALGPYDYRRPEREAARDMLEEQLYLLTHALAKVDDTWIGGH